MFLFGSVVEKVRKFADKVSLDSDNLKHLHGTFTSGPQISDRIYQHPVHVSQMAIGFSTLKKTSERNTCFSLKHFFESLE